MQRGHEVVILDDFSTSGPQVLDRIAAIVGRRPSLERGSVCDPIFLERVFARTKYDAVFHFAGKKSVMESVQDPLRYYTSNVLGTVMVLEAMRKSKVKTFVFSSSATVYGSPKTVPADETQLVQPANPYGQTKATVEQILEDLYTSDSEWRIACLRYFNPVGAHESAWLGEDPLSPPNNLFPYIADVADGVKPYLQVFGTDYPTHDGTGIRDYIHIMDLAQGHVRAFEYLLSNHLPLVVNLGRGEGVSVFEILQTFERVNQVNIPYQCASRRSGDIAACWADVTKAQDLLNWRALRSIEAMCQDTWRWRCWWRQSRRAGAA